MVYILLRKCNLELNVTATEVTESTERGVWVGKDLSVYSAESYKKQIWFSIIQNGPFWLKMLLSCQVAIKQ
jgi:hypothetical protein